MFTQIDYCYHQSGSSCPFCGQDLMIIRVSDKVYQNKRIKFKVHQCICSQNHMCFMIIENTDIMTSFTNKSLLVQTADWEDYINEQSTKETKPKETCDKHVKGSS